MPSKAPRTVGKAGKTVSSATKPNRQAPQPQTQIVAVTGVNTITNAPNIDMRRSLQETNSNTSSSDANSAAMLAKIQEMMNAASANGTASSKSRSEALKWLEARSMTVTPEGSTVDILSNHINGANFPSNGEEEVAVNLSKDTITTSSAATSNSNNNASNLITLMVDSPQLPKIMAAPSSQSASSQVKASQQSRALKLSNGHSATSSNSIKDSSSSSNPFPTTKVPDEFTSSTSNSPTSHLITGSMIQINGSSEPTQELLDKYRKEIASLKRELNEWKSKYDKKEKEANALKKQLGFGTANWQR